MEWTTNGTTNDSPHSSQKITADIVRHVNKVDTDSGWLNVKKFTSNAGTDALIALFKYCKVALLGERNGRVLFKILEGPHKGQIASLTESNAREYLGKTAPKQRPAELVVTYGQYRSMWSEGKKVEIPQQLASGLIDGIRFQATMNSVWDGTYYPIPPGTYKILLPDAPHNKNMTGFYKKVEPNLSHHQVWFPIQYGDNSRYIHVGNVSDGCTTVLDLEKWTAIQEALISHRDMDGKSIGNLIVKGKPMKER